MLRSTDSKRVIGMLGIGFVASFCVEFDGATPVKTYFLDNLYDNPKEFPTFAEVYAFYKKERLRQSDDSKTKPNKPAHTTPDPP